MDELLWIQQWLLDFKAVGSVWLESRRTQRREALVREAALQQDRLLVALRQMQDSQVNEFFSEALRFGVFYRSLPDLRLFIRSLKGQVAVDFGFHVAAYGLVSFRNMDVFAFAQAIAEGETGNIARGMAPHIAELNLGVERARRFAEGIGPKIAAFVGGLGKDAARLPRAMGFEYVHHFPRGTMVTPAYHHFEESLGKHLPAFKRAIKELHLESALSANYDLASREANSQEDYDGGY